VNLPWAVSVITCSPIKHVLENCRIMKRIENGGTKE
jgi:hypothetical protein